jgi:hypothetical protein
MSQCRSDSTRHSPRTRQPVQTAIAAAASWRAVAGSTLTGNHWSGSRPLSAHLAYPVTRVHKAWSAAAPWGRGRGGGVVTPHGCARRIRSGPARSLARLSLSYGRSFCVAFRHVAWPSRALHRPGPAPWQRSAKPLRPAWRPAHGRALQATGVSYGG